MVCRSHFMSGRITKLGEENKILDCSLWPERISSTLAAWRRLSIGRRGTGNPPSCSLGWELGDVRLDDSAVDIGRLTDEDGVLLGVL